MSANGIISITLHLFPAELFPVYLAYVGAVLLAIGVLVLGVGLVRRSAQRA
jgi:hypothetical protein